MGRVGLLETTAPDNNQIDTGSDVISDQNTEREYEFRQEKSFSRATNNDC